MTYSLTERKRIRKSFAKRAIVQKVPFLIATQLESYTGVPAGARVAGGAPQRRACRRRSPRSSRSSAIRATRGSSSSATSLGEPPFDVKECQQRGLTYASPLRAKVRLVILDKDAPKPTTKEVKEQEVYMGEIPLMTTTGSFIINGTERVIVSQLHRSPGVFFEHDRGKTHSSGKLLFSARVIPYRGSWLDFEFDPKDIVFFRVDRRRKMPVTILLKALGYTPGADPRGVLRLRRASTSSRPASSSKSCPSACAAKWRASTSTTRPARSIVAKDKRITVKHIRDMETAGIKRISAPDEFILGRTLAHNVVNADTGEIIANANDEITETLLAQLRESKVGKVQTLFTNDLDQGPYISQTLRADETADMQAARVAIYRMMRPGEPPTEDAVEALFNGLFFAEERYDLSAVGRMKFNRRINAPSEYSWQLRFRGIALPKEAEDELRAYFKHAPELSLHKVSLEGISTEAEAQAVVDKMFHDLKSKGIDKNKLEVRIEQRLTLSPEGHRRGDPHPGRAAQRPRRDRRHRPPRQPPRALGGRAGRKPVPRRPGPRRAGGEGAPVAGGIREPDAARPDQRQADLGGDQGVLRLVPAVAVHGPDQPAVRDHAQAPRLGPGTGRPDARTSRIRSARRAPDALRPRVPDRDAGRPEHRPDQLARAVRPHQQVRLPGDAVPQGEGQQGRPTRSSTCRRSRKATTSSRRRTPRSTRPAS